MPNFTNDVAIGIGINQYQNSIAKLNTAKPDAETSGGDKRPSTFTGVCFRALDSSKKISAY